MSRLADVRAFYEILGELTARIGGARRLRECDGRMTWPRRGVYFFLEEGEFRTTSGTGPRVVRVGTHALTGRSSSSLWNRLSQHRGVASSGGGNHRGSIFRLLVGEALARRDGIHDAQTWGSCSSGAAAARAHSLEAEVVRHREWPLEAEVTRVIGAMPFVWIAVNDAAGPESRRGLVERNSIALLSNFRREPIDPPSPAWLGAYSSRDRVRDSGLWNNNHVEESYDAAFLAVVASLARETAHVADRNR